VRKKTKFKPGGEGKRKEGKGHSPSLYQPFLPFKKAGWHKKAVVGALKAGRKRQNKKKRRKMGRGD